MDIASQAINHVASTLSAQLIDDGHGSNLIASPLGLVTILSMILAGSKNRTAEQLRDVLNVEKNKVEELHKSFQTLLSVLERKPDQANAFLDHEMKFEDPYSDPYSGYDLYSKSVGFSDSSITPSYRTFLNDNYRSSVEVMKDMDLQVLMNKVNKWVKESTYGRIEKILDKPPKPNTKLVLLNSLFFSGSWEIPFKHTNKGTFYNRGVHAKQVDMMSIDQDFLVASDVVNGEDVKIIELPYIGAASMVIIVPENKTALNKVVKGKISQVIERFDKNKRGKTVQVMLPKFKFESDINLLETIAAMGAKDLVDYRHADLSGMTGRNIGLYLNALQQKAQIDVHENGTVAAASTIAEFSVRGIFMPESVFNVDGPFVFVIRDEVSEEILFVGKVVEL